MSDTSAVATSPADDSSAGTTPEPGAATLVQQVGAELLGTMLLVLVGCGAFVAASLSDSGVDFLSVALAFGFALAVATHAFGRISGGHFNPAVSVAAAMSGRLSWARAGVYAGAQVAGAVLGSLLLFVATRAIPEVARPDDFLGQNFYGDGGFAWWGALLAELVLTAVLVTVHLAVTDERTAGPAAAPLTLGLSLAVLYLITLPLTGGSLNPARSFGPALFTGTDALADLWLFLLVPLVAAAGAGLAYPALFGRVGAPVAGSGLDLPRRARAASTPADGGAHLPQGQGYPQQGGYAGQGVGQAAGYHHPQDQAVQQAVYEPEPIIQDGWQWDHQAQEWKPLEHWPAPTHVDRSSPVEADPPATRTASTDLRRGEQSDQPYQP